MEKLNLYDELVGSNDTTSFDDKELEDINWHANIFDITYVELTKVLKEKSDDGTITNQEEAKNLLFDFCKKKVLNMVQNDSDFAEGNLEDDEAFAASFFEVL
ncbi:hypothetical protein N9A28_06455 [Sulfurimonas sp.]|nr:hypothetical protein [Sulfurimonas sp.]